MGLSARQEILFTSVADLYKPELTGQDRLDQDPGKIDSRMVLAYQDVRCFWRQTVSQSSPTAVGALETAGHHTFSFAEDQEIDEDWYIMDRTAGPTQNWAFHVVSKPQRILKRGDRDAGQTIVQALLTRTPHNLEPV